MLDISDKDEDLLFWVYWDFELCDNASTPYLYFLDLLLKFSRPLPIYVGYC